MSGRAAALRSVALPREHGGWSLTLEPAVLGLIVAPSWAGLALGVAALVAFLARTPAELALVDRFRGRHLDRTDLAIRLVAGYTIVLAALVVIAVVAADGPFWQPLVAAAPLLLVEFGYARKSRGRRLMPELAGSVGVAAVAAAIALAGGLEWVLAGSLWLVAAARAVTSVVFVRVQLRRLKHQTVRVWHSDGAQLLGLAGAAAGLWRLEVPVAAVAALGFAALVHLVEVRRPPRVAAVLGAQQVVLGLTVVVATGLGLLAP